MKKNHSTIVLLWKKSSRHIFVFLFYEWKFNLLFWFCIFKTLEKEIFTIMHDDHYHADFHQVYNNIVANLYIWNLSQHLKQYITYCLKCLHYQTMRHTSYEALQLIVELSIFFHIIIINFILELLKISTELDAMIIIICKFFKKMKFILSKEIWTVTK